MIQINFSPENVSKVFQHAVDEVIEQHRLKGQAIAVSDEQGNPIEVQPQDITPLAQKQEQRQQKALSTPSSHSTTN